MPKPAALACVSAVMLAIPAHAEAEESGFSCVIASIRNVSTAERPPIKERERFFAHSDLDRDGSRYMLEEELRDEATESFITHTIDASNGQYAATTWLTDHAYGETYVIETTGACTAESAGSEGHAE